MREEGGEGKTGAGKGITGRADREVGITVRKEWTVRVKRRCKEMKNGEAII